jgi:hypothetical protein
MEKWKFGIVYQPVSFARQDKESNERAKYIDGQVD